MKEPMAVKTTTHAMDLLVSVAWGLIGSPFALARLGGPLSLEIRRALRIHRSRQAEAREELRGPEWRDLADPAIGGEGEDHDRLGVPPALVIHPVGGEGRLSV